MCVRSFVDIGLVPVSFHYTDYFLSVKSGMGQVENQMRWVQKINNIRNRAMEIVNTDLIYN